jgi:protein-S-isoprenylcysteine O-methyltransferase Ste14
MALDAATPELQLVALAVSWIVYGIIHSLLASDRARQLVRKAFPDGFRTYRLIYNLLAVLLLLIPLWLMARYPGDLLWHWSRPVRWIMDGAAVAALAGFAFSLRMYDNAEFLGLRQLSCPTDETGKLPPMSLSTPHRFVRHPWYFYGLVILWTREMNAALLTSAIVITLYLVIGSRLEERKLVACYGEAYREYQRQVPALIPLPWRYLTRSQAEAILKRTNQTGDQ